MTISYDKELYYDDDEDILACHRMIIYLKWSSWSSLMIRRVTMRWLVKINGEKGEKTLKKLEKRGGREKNEN